MVIPITGYPSQNEEKFELLGIHIDRDTIILVLIPHPHPGRTGSYKITRFH
jgi:hypothetical protein